MLGYKATHFSALGKATAAQIVRTQLLPPPPQAITNQVGVDTLLHPDLLQPRHIALSIMIPLSRPPLTLPASKLETLSGFQLLQVNLIIEGANDFLNNIEERLIFLEEILHNAPQRGNTA